MPRSQGWTCATHVEPPSDAECVTPMHLPPPSTQIMVPALDLFQHTVILTEGMNALKSRINAEKQSRHENPSHLDPISSDKEELHISVTAVPITSVLSSPPPSAPTVDVPTMVALPIPTATTKADDAHIPVKNGFSNPTKAQEGRDWPRKDLMNRHRKKALREGCHERKEARAVVSSREKMNNK